MELFQELNVKVSFSSYASISDEEARAYQTAKEQFLKRLKKGKKQASKGVELVVDIFKHVDQLSGQYFNNNSIACKDGCSWCCHQLVCCTTLEMKLIINYLNSLHRKERSKIRKRVVESATIFDNQHGRKLRMNERWEAVGELLTKAHYGIPCVFLADDSCSIYPVRPIDCRSARAKIKCGFHKEGVDLGSVKFFFDQIASDLIMEAEERRYGQQQVVPLIGWPLAERFYSFFFNQ